MPPDTRHQPIAPRGLYLVRWEPALYGAGFQADIPAYGRIAVKRIAIGSRWWHAKHNGLEIKYKGKREWGSVDAAKAAAEHYYAELWPASGSHQS